MGSRTSAPSSRPSEGAYREPPILTATTRDAGGRLRLVGQADPAARVRLTSPGGQALFADASDQGVWRMVVAAPGEPRLFGLSMIDRGQTVQSEGYIALTPDGVATQLRAGAGAVALRAPTGQPAILAVDFDSKGGAVVSGDARPREALDLWVDGARLAQGGAAADGRFSLALDQPLSFTGHSLEVVGGGRRVKVELGLTPASPLSRGPYRASVTPWGWRIDWMTPGGGLQTTLLIDQGGRPS